MTVATSLPTGTITFVFTDIEGSTRLLTAVGSDYPRLLARHNELIRAEIEAANGFEVKTEGDSFFIVFTSATDAVAFASAAQKALARADWPNGVQIRVRMGIHTGEGMLSQGDYVGLDVHRAARVSAAAHGGQVLLSDSSRALVAADLPDGVSLRELGEHRLKDLPAPVRLFQLDVDGLPSDFPPIRSLGRGNLPAPLTSFVGREADIEAVSMLLGQSRLGHPHRTRRHGQDAAVDRGRPQGRGIVSRRRVVRAAGCGHGPGLRDTDDRARHRGQGRRLSNTD